jgi:Flp pilus assembly pilin Flp
MMIKTILRLILRNDILTNDKGATSIEYALLLALMAVAITTMMSGLATEVSSLWTKVGTTMHSAGA